MRSEKSDRGEFLKKLRDSQPFPLHDASSPLYPIFGKDGFAVPFIRLINSSLYLNLPHFTHFLGKMGKL
jgi:hypothetical protein